jgi:rod shape-determining protein MreC
MFGFVRRHRVLMATAVLVLAATALVVQSRQNAVPEYRLGRWMLEAMAPLQRVVTFVAGSLSGTWRGVEGLFRARDEVAALRGRVQELERDATQLDELELENARLRELLAFRAEQPDDYMSARVIGWDATGRARTVTIDRGESDGVVRGAAVIAPPGVVGHVFRTSPHAARVLLITDHNSGVDALVQRTRARGIVEGREIGGIGLKFVKRTESLEVGDEVVTSGMDRIFPKGLPVGTIAMVDKRGQGLFQYASIRPAVDFDRLEEVLVLRTAAPDAGASADAD